MRKYDFEKVKSELEKRLENEKIRLDIYSNVLIVAKTIQDKEITKRVEEKFKEQLSKYNVYYESENDYFGKERAIKVYYDSTNWNKYETIKLYYYNNYSGEEYTLANTYIASMEQTINYITERIEMLKNERKNLKSKVEKFNKIMSDIEKWQEINEELKYIMEISKY